ncbi:6-phosphogluconate dehydrogenase [Fusarium sp. NRRL 52700]|nr:6-phosphogluconate dehydrogenase [Fusarium sp. NRRL 52700]
MSPGGDPQALEIIMPLLRRVAAKDCDGKPCTSPIGPGGSGHYVKMIHNGIEQGMMSVISEVWYILTKGLQLGYDEAAGVFEQWNQTPELCNTFLIYIAVDINKAKDQEGRYVLGKIQDKVVQDVDNTEGTGTWSCEEAVRLHVPAANIVSAHLFRCTSAELSQRAADAEVSGHWQPSAIKVSSRDDFIEDLRKATYFCLLLCFTQGLQIIREMDQQHEWHIDYHDLLHVWSAGSIIQAGGIMDLLHKVYSESPSRKNNLLSNGQLGKLLASLLPSMKRCILSALEADMVIPAMSQSLDYYKYSTSVDLPTQLTEAELDYFGNHKFDLKEEHRGEPSKGKHHFEWKPAREESDKSRLYKC